jgi:D-3-phosphoglycerate dehydrogenase
VKVLVTDNLNPAGIEMLEAEGDIEVDVRPGIAHEDLVEIMGDYEALIRL